jgi:hypothetical protein
MHGAVAKACRQSVPLEAGAQAEDNASEYRVQVDAAMPLELDGVILVEELS